MEITDKGIIGNSFIDFTIPTQFAKNTLYYVTEYGHYFSNENYFIKREKIEWFLLAYVYSGALYLETKEKKEKATAGQMLFLDCRYPHCYYCKEPTEFLWFHYLGSGSINYAALFKERGNLTLSAGINAKQTFEDIFFRLNQSPCNEHQLSADIHILLGHFATQGNSFSYYEPLLPAISHIQNHFNQPLILDDLASLCSMSTSHFIRTFQKHMGQTPHSYLVSYRLNNAKKLMASTDLSMEEIAEQCGFNSASHFTRAFRADNGITPSEFRQNL